MTTFTKENLVKIYTAKKFTYTLDDVVSILGLTDSGTTFEKTENLKSEVKKFIAGADLGAAQYLFILDGVHLFADLEERIIELMGEDAAYKWMDENEA